MFSFVYFSCIEGCLTLLMIFRLLIKKAFKAPLVLANRLKLQKHKFKIHHEQDVLIQKSYQLLLGSHLMKIINRFLAASGSPLF